MRTKGTLFAIALLILAALAACTSGHKSDLERNKALVRRAHEVWSEGNLAGIDQIWAENVIGHAPDRPDWHGRQALQAQVQAHRATFPDWKENVQEVIAEGDRVAARWISTGTDMGGVGGSPATGRRVRIQELGFYRIENGRIAEQWVEADVLSLERQLRTPQDSSVP